MKKWIAIAFMLLPSLLHAAELPAWLSGHWSATIDGVQMEEYWTTPAGGLLLGVHRDIRAKKTSFEFMRIESRGEQLVFVAQPSGRPPTEFPSTAVSAHRIVFENPSHDFPKRIVYWRDGDQLCARVEGDGEEGEQWCWKRASSRTSSATSSTK
ncbi:MAG TPA: DUF6265 family protein [Thermoanaerobaculia bacterium]|jgi:hypothetical protein|nr:DUF6265 family protein [Thermoanaerobaculia bacterium]